ncbi:MULTISPECIES: hypothetical protein [unclassified Mucilaginibacter]|uniref:hypothetical protein n=1 Tax=unclassified Mucilaginibacter TaxID=2617802 RepID=UPI00096134C1|nr:MULTISPECIES: hypothetical protein [unclassified Mucilaginibacter]OJW13536.1 MAG: hypothetical protein BGO48_01925 [Mucilaginibacter sp. 44-25]PLW89777.1 MAG: hypothetical protein C0154_09810 [Mucilaginibacter sp.]HEK20985.1 hypothetical protein [Bacteroidota bacterium]
MTHSTTTTNTTEKPKSKKFIWIAGLLVCAILVAGYLNFNYLRIVYAYHFKWNNFKNGDKVYVSPAYFADKDVNSLGALRLVRPLNYKDLDKMELSADKKQELRSKIDTNLKPYMCFGVGGFYFDDFMRYKSGNIGTYDGKLIANVQYSYKSQKLLLPDVLYIIKPNKRVFTSPASDIYLRVPENYTLADSNIYVTPSQVSPKELINFRK